MSNFQDLFSVSFSELNKYLEAHPVYNFYKTARIFNPRGLLMILIVLQLLKIFKILLPNL